MQWSCGGSLHQSSSVQTLHCNYKEHKEVLETPLPSSARGWGDYECAAFASVLAATDPVAVVGLLKARSVEATFLRLKVWNAWVSRKCKSTRQHARASSV